MFGRKSDRPDPPDNLPAPLPVLDSTVESRSRPRPLPLDDPEHPHREMRPRSFQQRMWDIPVSGWVQLAVICLIVGTLLSLSEINVFAPGFTVGGALGQLVNGVFRGMGWLISRGWQPFLFGVLVVMPLWIGWRALSALWRR